jgi:hypothetical protein
VFLLIAGRPTTAFAQVRPVIHDLEQHSATSGNGSSSARAVVNLVVSRADIQRDLENPTRHVHRRGFDQVRVWTWSAASGRVAGPGRPSRSSRRRGLAQSQRNDELSAVGGIANHGPGTMDRAATRVDAPVVDDRTIPATDIELLGQRRQLVDGQRRLHQDDGIPGPHVVDFQLDVADLNEPHPRRLAAEGALGALTMRAIRGRCGRLCRGLLPPWWPRSSVLGKVFGRMQPNPPSGESSF